MYTPSAYTLTNTTRPHELNAKSARPPPSGAARGRIGILAKEQTVHNSAQRQNHRQSTHRGGEKSGPPGPDQRTNVKAELPWISSVQPRALTHISIHRRGARSGASPTLLRPWAQAPIRHYTRSTHPLHSITLNYTRYGYVKPIDFVNCRK